MEWRHPLSEWWSGNLFAGGCMQSPLVVDALREQLCAFWSGTTSPAGIRVGGGHSPPERAWQIAVRRHHAPGESFLLTEPMLDELGRVPCWLDGAVRVRLEPRRLTQPQPWLDALARPDRPRLVEALAVYFDPDTSPEEAMAFQAMAGVLTPRGVRRSCSC